jgi:hypothetical protein
VRSQLRSDSAIPNLEHGALPDTISETLGVLITHVERLEERLNGRTVYGPALHAPEHGV